MSQTGRALVMIGDREITGDTEPLTGGYVHVKTGRVIDSAPEAPTIMRGN